MKTLCSKPCKGGKIHPSPPVGDVDPTAAALRLLPAAFLVLTAALRPEDQQVLAYLVTRSLQGAATPQPEPPVARGRRRRAHPPAIGCGCFDCYTSFWSRWDCSPNRELIHVVIEAFEDHLAAAESASSTPSSSKRRDKGKRKPPPTPPPPTPPPPPQMSPQLPESQLLEKVQEPSPTPASPRPPPPAPAASTVESDEEEKVPEDSNDAEAETVENEDAGEEERKRGWADVMGMLSLRLWGIRSPAVESAT